MESPLVLFVMVLLSLFFLTLSNLTLSGASPAFKNQELAVVGGGDSAAEEAIYLTKYGKHVSPLSQLN